MINKKKLDKLRELITENLRVQRDGEPIDYIDVGTAVRDASSRQNHAIFARRGSGKTLLLHDSGRRLRTDLKAIYLNCEDFKRHSFPNVLIEILSALFREIDRNLYGWFGKKKKSKEIIKGIILRLSDMQRAADIQTEEIRRRGLSESTSGVDGATEVDIDQLNLKFGARNEKKESQEIERSFQLHRDKLKELDLWLPTLKESIRTFFPCQVR